MVSSEYHLTRDRCDIKLKKNDKSSMAPNGKKGLNIAFKTSIYNNVADTIMEFRKDNNERLLIVKYWKKY